MTEKSAKKSLSSFWGNDNVNTYMDDGTPTSIQKPYLPMLKTTNPYVNIYIPPLLILTNPYTQKPTLKTPQNTQNPTKTPKLTT